MDKDEIICMAQEAGFSVYDGIVTGGISDLERFAALVAAHEREACAKVCEKSSYSDEGDYFLELRAAVIRARGNHA